MTSAFAPAPRRPPGLISSPAWALLPRLLAAAAFLLLPAAVRAQAPATGKAAALESSTVAPAPEKAAGYDVFLAEMGTNKISVIKQVRDAVPGLGLADAKALVENAPKPIKRGVTKAEAEAIKQRVEAAGAKVTVEAAGAKGITVEPAPAPPAEGKASCDVILTDMGPNKIAVIKEVRAAVPGIGLAEAKMLVESAPRPIKEGVTRQEAEGIKKKIEAAGAKVMIR